MDPRVNHNRALDILEDAKQIQIQFSDIQHAVETNEQEKLSKINSMPEAERTERNRKANLIVAGVPSFIPFRRPKQKPVGYTAYKRTEVRKYLDALKGRFEEYKGGPFQEVLFSEFLKLKPDMIKASFAMLEEILQEVVVEADRDARYYGRKVDEYMKDWEEKREQKQEEWYEEKRKSFPQKRQESSMAGNIEKQAKSGDYFNEYLLPDFEALDKELGSAQWVQRQQTMNELKMQNSEQDAQGQDKGQDSSGEIEEQREETVYRPTYDRRKSETKQERLERIKEEYGRRPFISVGSRDLRKRRQQRIEQLKGEYPDMKDFDPAMEGTNANEPGFTQIVAGFCKASRIGTLESWQAKAPSQKKQEHRRFLELLRHRINWLEYQLNTVDEAPQTVSPIIRSRKGDLEEWLKRYNSAVERFVNYEDWERVKIASYSTGYPGIVDPTLVGTRTKIPKMGDPESVLYAKMNKKQLRE